MSTGVLDLEQQGRNWLPTSLSATSLGAYA